MARRGHLSAMTEDADPTIDRAAPTLREPSTRPPPPRPLPKLLTPADLDANPWAACGQAALAALLERPLADVRHAFPPHRWVNLTQMRAALSTLGAQWTNGSSSTWEGVPQRGLVLIQFHGPWTRPSAPVSAALKHAHWVAVVKPKSPHRLPAIERPLAMVFDVNALDAGWNGG